RSARRRTERGCRRRGPSRPSQPETETEAPSGGAQPLRAVLALARSGERLLRGADEGLVQHGAARLRPVEPGARLRGVQPPEGVGDRLAVVRPLAHLARVAGAHLAPDEHAEIAAGPAPVGEGAAPAAVPHPGGEGAAAVAGGG